jgi:hypothetical protein
MTQYFGLDVSLKETKVHVLDEAGNRVWRGRCATEPAAIAAAVRRYAPTAVRRYSGMSSFVNSKAWLVKQNASSKRLTQRFRWRI